MIDPATLSQKEFDSIARFIPAPEPALQDTSIPGSARKVIPVCETLLAGNEGRYLQQCVDTNWISSQGSFVTRFEEAFSSACGCEFGVSCSSGTAALHLVMAALGIGPGDEVLLPTFTMIATANAVRYCGATPVLVDAEPHTCNIDPAAIEAHVTSRTKAIILVHTYGHPADMNAITAIAERHGIPVIEDAAEAHGAEFRGRRVGGLGLAGTFSFYGNKIITTGEGGMVTTNDKAFADRCQELRDHAFSKERHFWHKFVGFNYRMTNLQAAVGLAQTERLDGLVDLRRRHANHYHDLLADTPGLRLPTEKAWAKNVFWMYGIVVENEFGCSRDALRLALAKAGIETRAFFIPMHLQPIYFHDFQNQSYPVAEDLCQRGLYLPSGPTLTREEIVYITNAIHATRSTPAVESAIPTPC